MPALVELPDAPVPRARRDSAQLHARVRKFADAWEKPALYEAEGSDDFERLALDIARFQAEQSPGFARLVELTGSRLDSVASIPAVPVDAFRLARVAVHPPELDQAAFRTSGTTAAESGIHPVRDLDTYLHLSALQARHTLFSRIAGRAVVVALGPSPGHPPVSSLGFMMRMFMERFDGRALSSDPQGVPFGSDDPGRWLASPAGIDVEGLAKAARLARQRSEPLVVLATSFALVGLLDALEDDVVRTPERTFVMVTGGFKGRSREVSSEDLHRDVARALGTTPDCLLGEYGMTELSSQLYEAWTIPAPSTRPSAVSATRGPVDRSRYAGQRGVYHAPPWLRVSAVDPTTLEELPEGELGLARFVDLANVDSAVAVQTEDRVRVVGDAVELHGRSPSSPARGCSLPFEGLISGGRRHE